MGWVGKSDATRGTLLTSVSTGLLASAVAEDTALASVARVGPVARGQGEAASHLRGVLAAQWAYSE